MKRITLLLALAGVVLSGCVAYEEGPRGGGPYHSDRGHDDGGPDRRDRDRDGVPDRSDRDRDGDGVQNSRDRRPGDPRRY